MPGGHYTIRPFESGDEAEVLTLLASSLGWVPDEHYAAYFAWKHRQNPFGQSYAWVAEADDRIIGFRTMLRWRFRRGRETVDAVRAVDTATHPDFRGAGVFSRLTKHALDEMAHDEVGFVFNTPNQLSRPGYLKLGWREVGRLPAQARPRSLPALARMVRSRIPAERWSQPCAAGDDPAEVFADDREVEQLLSARGPADEVETDRSAAYLRWRYAGFPPLMYRALAPWGSPRNGVVVFRVRRRGQAVESAVVDVLAPGRDRRKESALATAALQASGADYALGLGGGRRWRRFLRSPRLGPVLTWRAVTEDEMASLASWSLSLGDIELF